MDFKRILLAVFFLLTGLVSIGVSFPGAPILIGISALILGILYIVQG